MAQHTPDVAIIVYNDHANAIDLRMTPTFAIGTTAAYDVAGEGGAGARSRPWSEPTPFRPPGREPDRRRIRDDGMPGTVNCQSANEIAMLLNGASGI
jgi:hypothetical protein